MNGEEHECVVRSEDDFGGVKMRRMVKKLRLESWIPWSQVYPQKFNEGFFLFFLANINQ